VPWHEIPERSVPVGSRYSANSFHFVTLVLESRRHAMPASLSTNERSAGVPLVAASRCILYPLRTAANLLTFGIKGLHLIDGKLKVV